ncbi:MAG TPA: nuclear transport factor 2 family protein [Ktedonobacteraceae bacterium]|jgi:ketosteroid isomerase-like protein|nr:nuclear transport factor 2 family protein [Ktedonobacteraceae bacterium]
MTTEDEVRRVSDQFYTALNRMVAGDSRPMMEIWSHSSDVTTMHPLGGREIGWEQVRVPWEQVASMSSGGHITLRDPLLRVVGGLAYEVGTEAGQATIGGQSFTIEQRVTNIYRREAGGWKIVHHHTDLSPAMQDFIANLQPPPG